MNAPRAETETQPGRFLVVGEGIEIEEIGEGLRALGYEVARGVGAVPPHAIFAAWPSGRRFVESDAGRDVPVVWVCARAAAASVPAGADVVGYPLSRAEIATQARALLHRHEQALSQAEARRLREMFIAMVAHDLKNPLATVIGNAEYLGQAAELSQDSRESVADLLASATVLGRVLHELVDTGHGLDGPLVPALVPVDVGALLHDIARASFPRASVRGVAIAVESDLGPGREVIDRDMVRRVVETILDSSLKHAPTGTTVTLRARPRPGLLRFEVHDDGRPIPADERARMFDRAAVFDHSTSGGAPRAVRRLAALFCLLAAEAHDGRIWVESAPGAGVTFCLDLRRGSITS